MKIRDLIEALSQPHIDPDAETDVDAVEPSVDYRMGRRRVDMQSERIEEAKQHVKTLLSAIRNIQAARDDDDALEVIDEAGLIADSIACELEAP